MICYNFEKSTPPTPSSSSMVSSDGRVDLLDRSNCSMTISKGHHLVLSSSSSSSLSDSLSSYPSDQRMNVEDNYNVIKCDDDDVNGVDVATNEDECTTEEEEDKINTINIDQLMTNNSDNGTSVDASLNNTNVILSNRNYILKTVSCEHIMSFRKSVIEYYSKCFRIFIQSTARSREIKAKLWRCPNGTCKHKIMSSRLHVCLNCLFVACYTRKHIHEHYKANQNDGHIFAMDINYGHLYCFLCEKYIFDDELEDIAIKLKRKALVYNQYFPYSWQPNNRDEDIFYTFANHRFNNFPNYGLRGLINLGSTCFMNCIVQTLVHTGLFRDYFLGDRHICSRDPSKCLACEMSQLVQEFYSGKNTPHIPDKLLHLVWTHAKHLAGYEQQDAHEFFISTLNILHRHSSEGNNDTSNSNKKCGCIIDQIFAGSLQSDLVCQCCGVVSSVEDPIWDFSLDLVNTANIEKNRNNNSTTKTLSLNDCLELFTRTEHLGSIKCNHCQSYQESTKQLSLKTLPIVVSFHLKRFEQTNRLNKKISTFVSFPTSIDMTPYTTSVCGYKATMVKKEVEDDSFDNRPIKRMKKNNKDNNYTLFAVVNHNGTLETGHYTVFIKSNSKWFKCDDHLVMNATETEVLNSEGYLLFYEKKPRTWHE